MLGLSYRFQTRYNLIPVTIRYNKGGEATLKSFPEFYIRKMSVIFIIVILRMIQSRITNAISKDIVSIDKESANKQRAEGTTVKSINLIG